MAKFIQDTALTFIIRVINIILALLSSVMVNRILGPTGKGIYALAVLLPTLLMTFSNIGVGAASVYYIGHKKYSPKEVFGINIIFSIVISIFAILVGLIIIFFFGAKMFPGLGKEYLLLALLMTPLHIFLNFILSILLAIQKIKKYNLVSFIQEVIYLFLVAIFIWGLHLGVKTVIIIEFSSFFIACITLFFWTFRETKGISFKFKDGHVKEISFFGVKIYLANVVSFFRKRFDFFLVNLFLNPTALGFYSTAEGLAERILLMAQSSGIVLFPRVSSEKNKTRLKNFTPLVCRNTLFITLIAAILLFLSSNFVITAFYSEKFHNSIQPFNILLIGAVAVSGIVALGNDIAGRGKPMINAYIGIISVVINIILDILWVPRFNIMGAAWASIVSDVLLFLIVLIVYSRISGNRIKDIIFIKKSDFRFYKNFLILFKNKYFNYSNNQTR